jgi:ABC-type transport system involved in multi-copper enzyme maturation permease subunit
MSVSSQFHLGLPLLAKELTEQSARRRTYIIRAVYATALYGFTLWTFWNQLGSWSSNSFSMIGKGRELFEALAWLQFAGLYLFLPAMTCGVLTSEKERETLSLLLLTKLGPWTIVFEKLFGRLVPMASFVLLSTPLLAVAYSLGGVEAFEIGQLAWSLSVTAMQVGSLSLACSAWCRTTASAFLTTYLLGAAIIIGPPALTQEGNNDPTGVLRFIQASAPELFKSPGSAVFSLFGPWLCLHPDNRGSGFLLTLSRSIPMMASTGICLILARAFLWRRAFIPPSNYLLKAFKLLDTFFHKANQNRFTQGIVLTHEHVELPLYDPIRWREIKKRSIGTTRYLVRFLILLEIPVVIAMRLSMFGHQSGRDIAPVYVAAWALWIVAALVLTIQSTGLIGLERSRQTLDVLLTTTQSSDVIVQHKFAGVWRMIRTLWVPFATVYFFQIYCQVFIDGNYGYSDRGASLPFAFLRAFLAVAIYPLLIAWIGFHQGMRQRSQTQATLVTLGLLTGVCLIPIAVAEYALPPTPLRVNWNYGSTGVWSPLIVFLYGIKWISPAHVLSMSPAHNSDHWRYYVGFSEAPAWLGLLIHFALAGGLLVLLRVRGMRSFASHVNRNDGLIVDDDDIDRLASLRKQIVGSGVFRKATDE